MHDTADKIYFRRTLSRLERRLAQFLPATITKDWLRRWVDDVAPRDMRLLSRSLVRPARYLLGNAGKRWRPLCGILMLEMMGKKPAAYELLLAAVTEVCHTGALIIDDIQDDSRVRRGRVCVHTRHGTAAAINIGNTLYFLPWRVISAHPKLSAAQQRSLYDIMSRQFIRAHLGQAFDLSWAGRGRQAWRRKAIEHEILQAYADKTGAVVEGVCEIAAVIAGCSPQARRQAGEFGRSVGIAYQILDDVSDITADESKRRPAGEDIQEATVTIVLVWALRRAAVSERQDLLRILANPRLRQDRGQIQRAREIIIRSGAIPLARAAAERIFLNAWRKIARHYPVSPARRRLEKLCRHLLQA